MVSFHDVCGLNLSLVVEHFKCFCSFTYPPTKHFFWLDFLYQGMQRWEDAAPAVKSSDCWGRGRIKGCVSPQTPTHQLPCPAPVLIPSAALLADVVGGSRGDSRLREDTIEWQELCSWCRCLNITRRFGCRALPGRAICLWPLLLGLFCLLVPVRLWTWAGNPAAP